MARSKNGVNKSAEIRNVLDSNPKLSAADVVDILKAKNVTVRTQDVYNVKSGMKSKGRKKRGRKPQAAVNGQVPAEKVVSISPVQVVLRVRDLAGQVGGMKNLKQIVDAMA